MMTTRLFQLADSASNAVTKNFNQGCGSNCPNANTLSNTTIPAVTNLILYIAGIGAVIMIVIGGLRYILSAGNPQAVNDAKNTILYSVVGLGIAVSAYAIVNYVLAQFHL